MYIKRIHCRCKKEGCCFQVNYYPPITLEEILENPPQHNYPYLPGECSHDFEITLRGEEDGN